MADVCKEYGAGLYLLAEEARLEKEFYEQLVQIKTILEENPSYSKLLSSPSLAFAEKKILIEQAFDGRAHEYIVNFMLLMCERGYFSFMTGCIDSFKKKYFESFNISEGVVISAYPLNEDEKERLRKALETSMGEGKRLILEYSVDESLLGGFFVEVDGKVIDSTLKTRLSGLKEHLSKPI